MQRHIYVYQFHLDRFEISLPHEVAEEHAHEIGGGPSPGREVDEAPEETFLYHAQIAVEGMKEHTLSYKYSYTL